MNLPRSIVLSGALLLPALAGAQQEAAAPLRDRQAVTYDEIERGLYFGVLGGPVLLTQAPAAEGRPRPSSWGQMAAVELGVDIGQRLSVGAFLMGSVNRAGSDYLGYSDGAASGDFSTLVPGGVVRLAFLSLPDSQGVHRTWFYLRGGGGYALFSPKQLLPDPDILVFAGPGVEYYTRLRHFSVGIEVTGSYLVSSGSFGLALSPSLRYAF